MPGRAAGSNASIDWSSDLRLGGTRAAFQFLERKRVRLLSAANFFNVAAGQWRFPGKRKPERGAERINVRAHVDWAALELFRLAKFGVPDESSMCQIHLASGVRDGLGQTKVDDFHFQFRRASVTSR